MRKFIGVSLIAIFLTSTLSPLIARGKPEGRRGPKGPSVVDVAIAVNSEGPFAGQFDTLIAAVTAEGQEGVLDYLGANGQRTVFAPTDDAFAAIGLDEESVVTLDSEFLTDVLLYHVAKGRRYAADVLDSSRIRMLANGFIFPFINDAGDPAVEDNLGRESVIIVTDVEAANGIIHAVDMVFLPFAP
jgi:uncharacterized surface protein with fasciclin (FAS1) repeats